MDMEFRSGIVNTERHSTYFVTCGPVDGPLMFFVHGWPGISAMWRAHMAAFAADGWRCIAPDLRGYGQSSAPPGASSYTVENAVNDLAELHDHLGGTAAIWVGHDWGSAVVGALAAHHPQRCRAAVLTSWAYFPRANSLANLVAVVDRDIYPADEYPYGQWDYFHYYTTHFDEAVADLDADAAAALASIYRPGDPAAVGTVSPSASVTRNGGRFGPSHRPPAAEPDPALWPASDFDLLVAGFESHGFAPSCAWYINDDANTDFARRAPHDGRLWQPVLFVNGEWDLICTITDNHQGDPMREACSDLTIVNINAGHWLPLERPDEHISAIRRWLSSHR